MKFILKIFVISVLFMGVTYSSLAFFAYKVKQDYEKLIQSNRYSLAPYTDDLYMMCMLDYHINPNGKDMLQECNRIAATVQQKPDTPYYDFYVNYLKDILK